MQAEGIINVNVAVVCLDSTTVKVHPDACGALKKEENEQSDAHQGPQGMRLLHFTPPGKQKQYLLMDRAYSGKKMRKTVVELGYATVVPPKRNYKEQWGTRVKKSVKRPPMIE